jgi:hypothetical protein
MTDVGTCTTESNRIKAARADGAGYKKASASEEKLRRWLVAGRTSRKSSNVSLLSDSFQDCLGTVNRMETPTGGT